MSTNNQNWDGVPQCGCVSDVGMRRTNNQDSYAVSLASNEDEWRDRGHLFLVADGMGAHAAGELASKIASDNVPHLYRKHGELSAPESLKRSVIETNAEINRKGQANEEFHNMGTTCSVLTLLPHGAIMAHVGDSRVYRLRGNRLEQLTFDHSLVWEMQASGQLSSDSDLSSMVPKNVITRSLGPYPDVKVDMEGPFPTQVGDTFLLCSDGLVGEVADDELGPMMAYLEPQEAAQALVDLANLRGGSDNITALVAKVSNPSMATSAGAEPLLINSRQTSSNKTLIPMLGAVAGASLLATLAMVMVGNNLAAAIAGGVTLIAGAVLGIRLLAPSGSGTVVSGGKRFGKGPYSQTDCAALKGLLQNFNHILDDLRKTSIEQDWSIDWGSIQQLIDLSDQANQANDQASALRHLTRALSTSMKQIRALNAKR